MWRSASLGPSAAAPGLQGEADRAAVREALREEQQERRGGCRGDLRGDESAGNALRAGEDARAARHPGAAPCAGESGGAARRQGEPDPWLGRGVWTGGAQGVVASASRLAALAGR